MDRTNWNKVDSCADDVALFIISHDSDDFFNYGPFKLSTTGLLHAVYRKVPTHCSTTKKTREAAAFPNLGIIFGP